MGTFMREDGHAMFYQIETHGHWQAHSLPPCWTHVYLQDYLGTVKPADYGVAPEHAYASRGECWQKFGHHGTQHKGFALKLLEIARAREAEKAEEENRKERPMRIVKRLLTQVTLEQHEGLTSA